MKKTFQYISFAFAIALVAVLGSCGGDEPSASELMTKKLTAHTWNLSSVMVDGSDQTSVYSGLTLTFTKTGYTALNGLPVWPASGTWEFMDQEANSIIRNDDLEVEIIEASNTSLKLSFNWSNSTFEPGRVSSVGGSHVFTLVK